MFLVKSVCFLGIIVFSVCSKFSSLDTIYQKGVDAYSRERWSECIVHFEESLHLYKTYKTVIINCRLKCNTENKSQILEQIEDLKIYELFLNRRNCLIKCLDNEFENVYMYNNVSNKILSNFQSRKPYEYLHLCYFEMNALPKAASAAYTYYVANTENEMMKNNVDYYILQPEVDSKEVIDLESEDYQVLYRIGLKAYRLKNWGETIANMEEALTHYLNWENSCRAECEHLSEQDWTSEFSITIANYIASVLTCRQKCQNNPIFNTGIELLAEILNYLQISYYHMERFEDASQAVATYLFLIPNDEDMLENKKIYLSLVDEKSFSERSDVVYYFKRDKQEKMLLNFFQSENNDNYA
ncbi:unnamed protein product [Danaus chrysippus]|uniref:(African queen) hypothetical protein n=1 Tax=Danaus chrysippus TaxID=151541 RepID=A0A8J2R1Y9_9NEOP|nr:unnamed protein product [Danaus chrysippus]